MRASQYAMSSKLQRLAQRNFAPARRSRMSRPLAGRIAVR
jgi:hypothetical protein